MRSASGHIQGLQNDLTQMNVRRANVLANIISMTGRAIIKAILVGERDPSDKLGASACSFNSADFSTMNSYFTGQTFHRLRMYCIRYRY
jgi:hypothetical protein